MFFNRKILQMRLVDIDERPVNQLPPAPKEQIAYSDIVMTACFGVGAVAVAYVAADTIRQSTVHVVQTKVR